VRAVRNRNVTGTDRRRGSRLGTGAILLLIVLAASLGSAHVEPASATATPGGLSHRANSYALQQTTFTAYDGSRWTPARTHAAAHKGRTIKTLVYVPKGATWPLPTVIFAPGAYVQPTFDAVLLRQWASAGYLVIGLDFPGSTAPNATGSILTRDLQNNTADLSFTYSWLQQHHPWSQMVDFSKVAAAGHSDGAIEVSALATHSRYADHRFAAFLELSGGADASFGCCYGPINTAPLFASAGTADQFGAYGPTIDAWNRTAGPKTLVTMRGADHWKVYTLWSGPQSDAIRATTVDWLNTALRHDPNATSAFRTDATRWGLSYTTATGNSVDTTYSLIGGARSPLGAKTSGVGSDARRLGLVGYFQRGAIYSTVGLGTNVVWGSIWSKYASLGSISGRLGYPTSNERLLADGRGRVNSFQNGLIVWSASTGARAVDGQILSAWRAAGTERGALGYPVSDTKILPDGVGRSGMFQGGSVFWSPATGTHVVTGATNLVWASLGWQQGWLGYPISDTRRTGTSQITMFQNGSIVSSSRGTYALTRAVTDRYLLAGGATGVLGPPTSTTSTSGTVQSSPFVHGSIVADNSTGTVTESVSGRAPRTGSIDSLGAWADRLYLAVLGRHVDPGGKAYVSSLARRGTGTANIGAALTGGTESHTRTARAIYLQVLDRPADGTGLDFSVALLNRGARPADLVGRFAASREFWTSAGSTDTGFVRQIYTRVLGRSADPAGLSYWWNQLHHGVSRADVARRLFLTSEVGNRAVRTAYGSVLGRSADPGGLATWTRWWVANGGSTAGVEARLAGSTELTDR
jgi:uncharacterized protein with LGFP repeats